MTRVSSATKPFHKVFKWDVDESTGCWNCTSHTSTQNGYVKVTYDKEDTCGHRVSYRVHHGDIPKGMVVRHKCDNKRCINPDHLEIGTQKQNMQDMVKRDRHLYGTRKSNSKLTDEAVKEILVNKQLPASKLAKKYGVHESSVHRVRGGKSWRRVVRKLGLDHLVSAPPTNSKEHRAMGIFVTDVKERCPDQWNHLLSDSSLDELHRFAGEIGIERDAFQPRTGVYALDETGRDAALDFGATNLPSMLDGKINPAMGRKFSKAMKLSNSLR